MRLIIIINLKIKLLKQFLYLIHNINLQEHFQRLVNESRRKYLEPFIEVTF